MDNVDARGRVQSDYQTVNAEPSMTIQGDAVEADIRTILKRHGISGIVEHLNEAQLHYGDITGFTDYAEAMRQVKSAEGAFMKLPSKVREVFDHDVAKWLDAANDGISDQQRSQLVKMGFLEESNELVKEVVASDSQLDLEGATSGAGTGEEGTG